MKRAKSRRPPLGTPEGVDIPISIESMITS